MKQRFLFLGSRSVAVAVACFTSPAYAVTLETVLQTTLERNPAIQEAKSVYNKLPGNGWFFVPLLGLTSNWACLRVFRAATARVKAGQRGLAWGAAP